MERDLPSANLQLLLPDFLVIAPGKTGSTWLAGNLNCHPEIFMPEIKEIHYFNQFLDLKSWDWYAELFRPGVGVCKGEATPGYCDLSLETMRLIRSAMPSVKLVYLMRDPVSRAWSHAKHCFRHRMNTFAAGGQTIDQVTDEQWRENFREFGSVRSGAYVKHLKKWLSVFPKEQLLIEFYDAIKSDAHGLLGRVFRFLGVHDIADYSTFPVALKLNEGLDRKLSLPLRQYLCDMYGESIESLRVFLRDEFQLEIPANWSQGSGPSRGAVNPICAEMEDEPPPGGPSFHVFEKRRLRFRFTPRSKMTDYFGFNIVAFKDAFLAISRDVGAVDLSLMSDTDLQRLEDKGLLFRSTLLEGVKAQVATSHLRAMAAIPSSCLPASASAPGD